MAVDAPQRNGTRIRVRARLREADTALRKARQALAELDRSETADLLGRFTLPPGEVPLEELGDFLDAVRAEYPGREVEVIVMAPFGAKTEE